MNNVTRTLFAAITIGAVSIGSAAAMPLDRLSPALAASNAQNVRIVCDENGPCYNTARTNRTIRRHQALRYYHDSQYYAGPQHGYYAAPQYQQNAPYVRVGIAPFGANGW